MEFAYTGIRVRNLSRSIKFYTILMGMRITDRGKMSHGGIFVQLASPTHKYTPQQRLELNWYPKNNIYYKKYAGGDELDHLAFHVYDVKSTFQKLKKKRVKVAVEPFTDGGWTLAYLKDPDGVWIELAGRVKNKSSLINFPKH